MDRAGTSVSCGEGWRGARGREGEVGSSVAFNWKTWLPGSKRS